MDPRLLRRYRFVVHDSKAPPLYKRESARVVRRFEAYGPKLFERLYWEGAGRKVPSGLDKKLVAARVFFGTLDSWFENRTSEAFYDASAFLFLKYAGRACALTLPAENSLESPIYRFVIDSLCFFRITIHFVVKWIPTMVITLGHSCSIITSSNSRGTQSKAVGFPTLNLEPQR